MAYSGSFAKRVVGLGGHLRRVLELQFSMQRGKGGRACDIHREPGPSLTPLYNSSPGIWGTSNLSSFPPKKECEPFHSDPVLKRVARETLETLAIKFSGLSQESISSRVPFMDGRRLEKKGPMLAKEGRRRRGENNLLSYIYVQRGTYRFRKILQMSTTK